MIVSTHTTYISAYTGSRNCLRRRLRLTHFLCLTLERLTLLIEAGATHQAGKFVFVASHRVRFGVAAAIALDDVALLSAPVAAAAAAFRASLQSIFQSHG